MPSVRPDIEPRAVKVADFTDYTSRPSLVINDDVIERIVTNSSAKDLPVAVLSIAGATRTGKSFLLNLIIDYLHQLESGVSF